MQDREVAGVRRAITWLHERANEMNDPHAKAILDAAAFNLGNQLRRWRTPESALPLTPNPPRKE